jgi:hypothetical protein
MNLKIDADALNRRRRRFLSAVQYTIYIKDNNVNVLVSADAPMIYMECEELKQRRNIT